MIFVFPADHKFSDNFEKMLSVVRADNDILEIERAASWSTLSDLEQMFFNFLLAKKAIAQVPEAKNLKIASLHPKMFQYTFESREMLCSVLKSSELMKVAYDKLPGSNHEELARGCQIFIDKFKNGVIYE